MFYSGIVLVKSCNYNRQTFIDLQYYTTSDKFKGYKKQDIGLSMPDRPLPKL
jgi:hypothetical protein